jgi:hypothetical protein
VPIFEAGIVSSIAVRDDVERSVVERSVAERSDAFEPRDEAESDLGGRSPFLVDFGITPL